MTYVLLNMMLYKKEHESIYHSLHTKKNMTQYEKEYKDV